MAVQITYPPIANTVLSGDWAFTFSTATSSLGSLPLSGGCTIFSGTQTVGVGSTEQECWQYIEDNNISNPFDPEYDLPYNIASSNGYGNTADPLNLNRN